MKMVVLSGSMRPHSRSRAAAKVAVQAAWELGAVNEREEVTNEALVSRIRELVAQAYQIGTALAVGREQAAAKATAAR